MVNKIKKSVKKSVIKPPEVVYPRRYFWFIVKIFLIVLFLILLILVYFYKTNSLVAPENISIEIENNEFNQDIGLATLRGNSEEVPQFHENMKFNHNRISYEISFSCSDEKRERILKAFNEISTSVELISFYESLGNSDIFISCSGESENNTEIGEDFFVAGEGGAREVIQTGRYNIITNGTVLLYDNPHGFIKCDWPNVELHELMHVFGFDHSKNQDSLMYPYLGSCDQRLDSSIISELKRLYSQENLADLYFKDFEVVKNGRYLDFNLSIKNSGDIDANNVSFTILEDGEISDTRLIGNIKYGAGVIMEIKFFKLKNKNPDKITFIIDYKKEIKELDKQNNILSINFD